MHAQPKLTEELKRRHVRERERIATYLTDYQPVRAQRSRSAVRFLHLLNEYRAIHQAVDVDFYRECYGKTIKNVALHYLVKGVGNGFNPHPLFHSNWYLSQNIDVLESGVSPFFHYLTAGEAEGRMPHPLFEPDFFRDQFSLSGVVRNSLIEFYVCDEENFDYSPCVLFDGKWYREQYLLPDYSQVNPLLHYLKYGFRDGSCPSRNFDEEIYRSRYGELLKFAEPALLHYVQIGQILGFSGNPDPEESKVKAVNLGAKRWNAAGANNAQRKTILVVAHAASGELYGAERSLIDVLMCIDARKYKVLLALPSPSTEYIELVQSLVDQLYAYSGQIWRADLAIQENVVSYFEDLIVSESVDLVYVNTILVREPHLAAKRTGVPSVCHVRELISDDTELANAIGEAPETIVGKVSEATTAIIANSSTTSRLFSKSSTYVVYNAIDVARFHAESRCLSDEIRVGILSANTRKKGIDDFFELASACAESHINASFMAFGPETEDTARIESEIRRLNGPLNFSFEGYIDDPIEALNKVDVVVNFSHFGESFGRTIVEAMAAGCCVIAYDHGALPEVLGRGGIENSPGALISYKKPLEALSVLKALSNERGLCEQMGMRGRMRARAYFSYENLRSEFNKSLASIMDDYDASPASSAFRKCQTVSVIVPNYNYAAYLPERLKSIFQQKYLPFEIIFLDDASSDDSINVATKILNENDIPFTVIKNETNEGVYAQWRRGIEAAKGDWVWIAEADDSCEPIFLERLLRAADDETSIVYAQSQVIDDHGLVVRANNRDHTQDISTQRWLNDYKCSGVREVTDALAFRNTIPNVSAAIIRRKNAVESLESLDGYQYVGDWAFYADILRVGNVAFVAGSLNKFRRHAHAVTRLQSKNDIYLKEVVRAQRHICEHFPITDATLSQAFQFLGKDYSIDGIEVNSTHAGIHQETEACKELVAGRKRWGFISTNMDSHTGGSEVLWRQTALRLRAEGDDVVVLCKKWEPEPPSLIELERKGVRLVFWQDHGVEEFVKLQPDLTVVSLGDQDDGIDVYGHLQASRLPYVILNQLTKSESVSPIDRRKRRHIKSGYSNARTTFFTSKNNLALMEKRLRTNLENSDIHFNPFHMDHDICLPFPSLDEGFQIAIPSKLHFAHKGQDLLVEVLKNEKWRARNVTFNLYGEGQDEGRLRHMIEGEQLTEVLLFKGRVDDIREIWTENHALLMPSRMEGMPIMLVSAMVCARVPIHTDVGGAAEVIVDGENGFIAQDSSSNSIDDALERAWDSRHQWKGIGKLARKSILSFIPEDPVADFIEKLRGKIN